MKITKIKLLAIIIPPLLFTACGGGGGGGGGGGSRSNVSTPDTPFIPISSSSPWHTQEYTNSSLSLVKASKAYEAGFTGSGVDVAVLDTGVDSKHNELVSNTKTGRSFIANTYNETTSTLEYNQNGVGNGQLEEILIRNDGSGYTTAPTITIEGDGTGAEAVAILDGSGNIEGVYLTNHGTGYSYANILIDNTGTGGSNLSIDKVVLSQEDLDGHGTAISSVIAAEKNQLDIDDPYSGGIQGIAFESNIIPVKVFTNETNPKTDAQILNAAIKWSSDEGVEVLNLSIGSSRQSITDESYLIDTIRESLDNNSSFVIAAGNDGLSCLPSSGSLDRRCSFPAAIPWTDGNDDLLERAGGWIVVGAVDENAEIESFSNKAGVTKEHYLVAPGSDIVMAKTSTSDEYIIDSGTSFATPYVSGAMALMYERFPHLDGNQMAQILFDTATDLGEEGIDDVYGNGLLNLEAAFQPIESLTIPTSKNITIGTLSTNNITTTVLITPQSFGSALLDLKSLDSAIAVDKYHRDFNISLSNAIVSTSSIEDIDENNFSFDNFQQVKYKNFIFGLDELNQNLMLGLANDKFSFFLSKENDLLGLESSGAFKIENPYTYYTRLAYKEDVTSKFQLEIALDYSLSNAKNNSDSLISNISDIHALGTNITLSYNDFIGMSYKIPRKVISGKMDFNVPVSREVDGEINYEKTSSSLIPNSTQQEYSLFSKYKQGNLKLISSINFIKNKNHIESSEIDNNILFKLNYSF